MTTFTTDPIAVVCTMTATDVYSCNWEKYEFTFNNPNRSKAWCEDLLIKNSRQIHDAMVRAAFEAIETLGELDRGDAKKEEMR